MWHLCLNKKENLSEIDLRSHQGTHKFKVKIDKLQDQRYESIRGLLGGEIGVLEYAFAPRTFTDSKTNKEISFTSLDFVSFKMGRNNNTAVSASSSVAPPASKL